ncbi:UDP-N-acetylglucosamine 1-carboxyvinyltransferase [Halolactibacillus halophilus]|uniref:UDP-N-acetylglucosamine 1-carboxyvinyltransferase n=1 Tax=Halolactibacillus halophilus TaxID=306540 RepID=A0A1I5RYK0_9BACI|nr:UDP-N-acetylglucosamine 1-carboxyvinyltransferase [Halolactibacillus halophilus]GEM02393.1 UDP-N-acetylglucosamine 1-carboxyvinyltransferase 1 [Halolactibacillus halophilus]SFP63589.1 UDP-N-acetylglucosamine 1-carboxyvinyltransferase [Halolactibacillus halophilus]
MEKIIINGGETLSGTVRVEGAKNAVLPIIAATILGQMKPSVLTNVPALADVGTMNDVLTNIGADVNMVDDKLTIDASGDLTTEAPFEFVTKMRASVLVLGPLLARYGHAHVAMPGGCAIGSRPIDLHLKGFEAMGATVEVGHGFVEVESKGRLTGATIYLDMASVGATENIMMAASLADGTTIIENAAKEPEIADLADFINGMGGRVFGAGTSTITIEGVEELTGTDHTIIPDRIEAGTFIVAGALTGGEVTVLGARSRDLRAVILKLTDMGVVVEEVEGGLKVHPTDELVAVDIKTLPHPGFPTDMQSQMMTLMLKAKGTSMVTETVFENRFMHIDEFRRMNAMMKIEGRSVVIDGETNLQGAEVKATDLRAGAALVLAGLIAEGQTTVTNLYHIDRGYVDFVGKLKALGANIVRVKDESIQAVEVSL